MDERDMKAINLQTRMQALMQAQIEGQNKTIEEQQAEITNLRKKIVKAAEDVDDAIEHLKETKKQYEELRDKHTRLVGQIMSLMEKIGR